MVYVRFKGFPQTGILMRTTMTYNFYVFETLVVMRTPYASIS